MKKTRNTVFIICVAFAFMVFILDGAATTKAAADAISVCLTAVVPGLLPFMFLSNLICTKISGIRLPLLAPLSKLCRLPAGQEYLLLVGLLGGYPVGAQSVSQAYTSGCLTKEDAQRMLGFCNNCGPGFIFGIMGQFFDDIHQLFALWVIHILSAIITSILLPGRPGNASKVNSNEITLTQAMRNSLHSMAQICGWVMLFRILCSEWTRWFGFLIPSEINVFLIGCVELTNGCLLLNHIHRNAIRFLCASIILALGGICVAMQTRSVVNSNLSMRYYWPGKLLQAAVSAVLCCLWMPEIAKDTLLPAIIATISSTLYFRKNKFHSRNLKPCAV